MSDGQLDLYFHSNNFISVYLFLFLAVLGFTASVLMGTFVLTVLVAYVFFFILIGGFLLLLHQKYHTPFVVAIVTLIVFLVCLVVTSYVLFVIQPGCDCYVNNEYQKNYQLDLVLNAPIPQQTFTPVPWNCMKYEIEFSQRLPDGLVVDAFQSNFETIPYIHGTVTEWVPTTKVEMYLKCVESVKIRCAVVTLKSFFSDNSRAVCEGRNETTCVMNGCQWCGACKSACV